MLSDVTLSMFDRPVSVAAVRSGVVGDPGRRLSIVRLVGREAGLVLPAASVTLMAKECAPSVSVELMTW